MLTDLEFSQNANTSTSVSEDPKALREEGQVPVWRGELWSACYPSQDRPSPEEEVNAQPRHPHLTSAPSLPVCLYGNPCNYHKVKKRGLSIPIITASSPIHWWLFSSCVYINLLWLFFFSFLFFCLLVGILILTEHSVVSLPMPFEVFWDSVLKTPFPCRKQGWSCTDCCCCVKQKHHEVNVFFFFALAICESGEPCVSVRLKTNGILSRFDITVKKCFITRCDVVVVIQDIYLFTGIAHLSIPVTTNVKRPVWKNMEAKSEAAGSGHSRPWFLPPTRLPVPRLHTHAKNVTLSLIHPFNSFFSFHINCFSFVPTGGHSCTSFELKRVT